MTEGRWQLAPVDRQTLPVLRDLAAQVEAEGYVRPAAPRETRAVLIAFIRSAQRDYFERAAEEARARMIAERLHRRRPDPIDRDVFPPSGNARRGLRRQPVLRDVPLVVGVHLTPEADT